jgi:hypothetical protein
MINYLTLPAKLRPYKVTDPKDLALDYQAKDQGGGGRTLHDDWALPFCRGIKRIDTAFMVPLPFRKKSGNAEPIWVPVLSPKWTFAPEAKIEQRLYAGKMVPHVLTMDMVHPGGQWSVQECWLGEKHGWTECYRTSSEFHSIPFLGKRKVIYYAGLKLDCNPTDLMAWFPEVSFSIKDAGVI